jgi:glucan endo-1,3-alpha-glucosidase
MAQMDDVFWVVVFAQSPAHVIISSAYERPQIHQVGAGISPLSHPLVPGGTMRISMFRDDQVVAHCSPSDFCVTDRPETYNFNVFVACS